MNAEDYMLLYEKYISGNCTAEEEHQLFQYKDEFILSPEGEPEALDHQQKAIRETILTHIKTSIDLPAPKIISFALFYKVAAILIMTAGLAFLFFKRSDLSTSKKNLVTKANTDKRPIVPGKNTAILTLSNGVVLKLDSLKQGVIATINHIAIKKSGNGLLEYTGRGNKVSVKLALNTISVPAGGNYSVTLPDGTMVWLNAASSLTYPLEFGADNRTVSLKGEAYFEVAKNKHKPFFVNMNSTKVEVLGTHFNIKAYESDPIIRTTLLEGSVRLSTLSHNAILVPGQQGSVRKSEADIEVRNVNTNKSVAWKNGYFLFRDDSIKDIMDQVSRWYDVDVEYRGNMNSKTFGGIYSKSQDINELLKGLEYTKLVHFKIEGRRIIVMA
jgi:transmembrane sensor